MQGDTHAATVAARKFTGQAPTMSFHHVSGYQGGSGDNSNNIALKRNSMGLNFSAPQQKRTRVASLSDLALQELASPNSVYRLDTPSGMDKPVLLTPTPTQFFFPKNVTEEQEAYAQGFAHALEQLYKRQGEPALDLESVIGEPAVVSNNLLPPSSGSGVCKTTQSSHDVRFGCSVLPLAPSHYSSQVNVSNGAQVLHEMQPASSNSIQNFSTNPSNSISMNPAVYSQPPCSAFFPEQRNFAAFHDQSTNFVQSTSINNFTTPFMSLDTKVQNLNLPMGSIHQNFPASSNIPVQFDPWSMPYNDVKPPPIMQHIEQSSNSKDFMANQGSPQSSCDSDLTISQLYGPGTTVNMDDQERMKLERKRAKNRVAAQKCQMRKVERISRLEDKAEQLREQNAKLAQSAKILHENIARLKEQIIAHASKGCRLLLPNVCSNVLPMNDGKLQLN